MRIGWVIGLLLAGCSGGEPKGGDCTTLMDGDWTFDGSSVGMAMGVAVAMDAEGCSFTLADWTMDMGSVPTGGTIEGDQVTLAGDDPWPTCTGTVNAEGDSAEGGCDDGTTWMMSVGNMSTTMPM